jgi:4,5-dihydroxyphthalate decarboxylase
MASHIVTTARGDSSYVGVPVFLSRSFRHSGIFVRSDGAVRSLKDLRGKNVGVPGVSADCRDVGAWHDAR